MEKLKTIHEVLQPPETTPERFRRYRLRLGYTLATMASTIGIGVEILSDAEKEPGDRKRPLTLASIRRMETATGLSAEEWL